MTVASSQFPSTLSNENEIKRYPTYRQVSVTKPDFTVAYVMAALLGFVFGIAIAICSGSEFSASALFNSETATNDAAVVIGPETTIAGKDFPFVSQTVKEESPTPASLLTVAVYKSAALESTSLTPQVSSAVHTHHSTRKASARTKFSARFRRSLRHRTTVSHEAPKLVAMPQVREAATATPATFMIEGDVTVADYDALAGMIETHEGRTFTIASAADESNAMPWPDSLSSVHYRCDQSGNCTLFHAGLTVSNVRMAS